MEKKNNPSPSSAPGIVSRDFISVAVICKLAIKKSFYTSELNYDREINFLVF